MVDKVSKYLKQLSKKDRQRLRHIIHEILEGNIHTHDIKKMK